MTKIAVLPCAIYTRKSSEDGLEQGFNSLDAQREACEAFILSQKTQGWKVLGAYEDGGFSGGNVERPGLRRLLAEVALGRVRIILVYKIDRLTRSLADFAKMVELFDAHDVSFVSVTQQFNTTSSMGRLTLNVLLSFAQFEREVTGERIRDKIAASKRKGLWMGGLAPVGYLPGVGENQRSLAIDEPRAELVRAMYRLYLELGCVSALVAEVARMGWVTPARVTRREGAAGGRPFSRGHLYRILSNPVYIGQIVHKDQVFAGQHPAILERELWDAVQAQMKANVTGRRTRANSAQPSLLTGLVFDEQGHRLTPSHAQKGVRRYRYYIDQVAAEDEGATAALRVPAKELETAVIEAVSGFLKDRSRVMGVMGSVEAGVANIRLKAAAAAGALLETAMASQQIEVLTRLVKRITVRKESIGIEVKVASIWSAEVVTSDEDEDVHLIEVPVQLKRCGMAVRLIVRPAGESATRGVDPKLVTLISKAHDWFERLSSGRCDSVQAIAQQEQIASSSYVTRVIYLAFLAPDIVQRIVRGEQPEDLTADRLIRMGPLPMAWEDQRVLLGMSG
ncbi:MAG: recombinase family protein [Rhizobacter sp.]|nr:recombinase family protein [Rhizobacter sp.]MBP6269169.1 recombinase family protein [Rhizobacter sp.]